jgi:hypothetical protein
MGHEIVGSARSETKGETSVKYTPLPITADLSRSSYEYAMSQTFPPIYLHVHPSMTARAASVIEPKLPGQRECSIEIVADETLGVNEWYLVSSIGSNPPC